MTLPASLEYGHVVGRIILAVADGADVDRMPDSAPATGTVTFTPKNPQIRVGEPAPVLVVKQPITCTLDGSGNVIDPEGATGAWLVTGVYTVAYSLGTKAKVATHDIEVLATHTDVAPLDLTTALPPGGPILTASEYAELSSRIDQIESGGVVSVNGAVGVVTLDAADVGALPDTYTPPAQSWSQVTDKPATFPPTIGSTATTAMAGDTAIPSTAADVGAATEAQGALADTAVQPADLPDPQTLSLTGQDLSLSGGGGTVTLPSGGGGGAPTMGSKPGALVTATEWGNNSGADSWRDGRVYLIGVPLYPARGAITITGAAVNITTAAAGAVVRVGLYASDVDGDPTGAPLTDVAIPADTTGLIEASLPTPITITPGVYWQATACQGGVPVFTRMASPREYGSAINPALRAGRKSDGQSGALPTGGWTPANESDGFAHIAWRVAT